MAEVVPIQQYIDALSNEVTESNLQESRSRLAMYHFLLTKSAEKGPTFVPPFERDRVITTLLNRWYSYDILQPLIDDPMVTDIHVIGVHGTLYRKNGELLESTECRFDTEEKLRDFISRQLDDTPYAFSDAFPITNAILPDGYRINIRGGESARHTITDEEDNIRTAQATLLTVRKAIYPFNLDDLLELNMFDGVIREFFRLMMLLGDNFVIAGGVNSAKTSLMNALTGENQNSPKISLIIEEIPEMTPLGENFIRLTNHDGNYENRGQIDMESNIINSLRMDVDNVYIGEVRDSNIAYQFLRTAMLTKYQTATTFHTHVGIKSAARGVMTRFILEATQGAGGSANYLNISSIFADHMKFLMTTKDTKYGKRVTEIVEVLGFDFGDRAVHFRPVFTYNFKEDNWTFHGLSPEMMERLEIADIETDLDVRDVNSEKFQIG